jgi:hypothetical protein
MVATSANPTSERGLEALRDRLEIIELTSDLLLSIDARDWAAAQELFTDPVYIDYTSLNGREPQSLTPAELIGGWRQALDHLEATQHLQGNHVIVLDGDEATCATNVQGTHVLPNATGGPIWTVGGRYDFQLTRTPSGWRIAAMTLTVKWATGNQRIMELAASRGSANPTG